jgi:hypothetical protein
MSDHIPITEERQRIACVECVDGYRDTEDGLVPCHTCVGLGYAIETDEQYAERTRDARSERLWWEVR